MFNLIPFLLEEASENAGRYDALFFGITAITGVFAVIVAVAIIALTLRYRRGQKVDRSNAPLYGLTIEIIWTAVPLVAVMGMFVWSTTLFFSNKKEPANALQVYVVGKQWMWKIQHPEGRWEMNELHIPLNQPIKLTMTSEDVIHSFFIPAFRLKQDVFPGQYSTMWFKPTKAGTYNLFCAEFCGTNHSGMVGTVTVMPPADYQRWLSTGTYQPSIAAQGEKLFRQFGCSGCHGAAASVRAPLLDGIYGNPVAVQIPRGDVPLERVPATTLTADDRYIHDSILLPEREIAAGFKPIMPTYKDRLNEEQILQIIAYLKSLGRSNGTSNGGASTDKTSEMSPSDYKARVGFTPANLPTITKNLKRNSPAANNAPAASLPGGGTPGKVTPNRNTPTTTPGNRGTNR